jgi:hypothetical protein
MRFTTWLRCQNKRQDPIGDLARDYITDIARRGLSHYSTEQLREVVDYQGCDGAVRAFKKALAEFRRVQAREVTASV